MNTYEEWLKAERDSKGIERQKLMDAEARGIEKRNVEIGKSMLKQGLDVALICEMTGLRE